MLEQLLNKIISVRNIDHVNKRDPLIIAYHGRLVSYTDTHVMLDKPIGEKSRDQSTGKMRFHKLEDSVDYIVVPITEIRPSSEAVYDIELDTYRL